jgi:hypothetical protein
VVREQLLMPTLNFLNADLEITSRKEPLIFLRELHRKVTVLYSGPIVKGHLTTMEVGWYSQNMDPVKTVQKWVTVLEALSPAARREFAKSKSRVIDLGFDIRDHKEVVQIKLPGKLVASLAKLKVDYVITLYSHHLLEPTQRFKARSRR